MAARSRPVSPGGSQRAGDDVVRAGDDLKWVVFDETGTGQDLPMLELMPGGLAALGIEHHESLLVVP